MVRAQAIARQIWRPCRLRTVEMERHATWLELFYDLVFVVAVAQLGHNLARDLTGVGVLKFAGLFVPVWWAWFHHTIYADRLDPDDPAHRLLTFTQIFFIGLLAASVHGALGETSEAFAIALAGTRVVQMIMYGRALGIEAARPLATRLIQVFAGGSLLWIISIFVPMPARFWIWGVALVLEFAVILHRSTRRRYAPLPISESHLPERFGLFLIIVLGESVAGVVSGLAEHELTPAATGTAAARGCC